MCIMLCEYLDLILLKYYSASNVVFILEGIDLFITVFKYFKMFTLFSNLKALMRNALGREMVSEKHVTQLVREQLNFN